MKLGFHLFFSKSQNELNTVGLDHNYAKPWSTHPDASNAQPLRMLFMDTFPRPENKLQESEDAVIDVEGEEQLSCLPYDTFKARSQMVECEKFASLFCSDQTNFTSKDDCEENIAAMRNSWSTSQNRIFPKVMRILQADRLSKMAITNTKNEPILRRLQVDKAARRIRQTFANTGWDMSLILWIHNLFLEYLRGQLFISYLEVLQTLKAKIPSLTEKLINGTNFKPDKLSSEVANTLLKKSWDPVVSSISQQKLKKLPENPVLVMIPSAPSTLSNHLSSKRHKFWYHQLAAMGKVINIVPVGSSGHISIASCVENMITAVRTKILEVRGQFKGRPVVLVGWHIGAVVACQVAMMEVVEGIVCLGFPTMGVCGNRWDIDDHMYNIKTPTLFVVGQHGHTVRLDMLEELRERLRVDTGLVVVGGADDMLRMCRAKKQMSKVTQSMVDRCIMDEIFDFVGNMLTQASLCPQTPEEMVMESFKKPRKRKQKDLASNVNFHTVENIAKQPSIKAVKALALSRVANGIFSGQATVSSSGKIGKKQKKSKFSQSYKKSLNLASTNVVAPRRPLTPEESAQREATAIASAPELSNLLQSIKTSSFSTPSSPTFENSSPNLGQTKEVESSSNDCPQVSQSAAMLNVEENLSSKIEDKSLSINEDFKSLSGLNEDYVQLNGTDHFSVPISSSIITNTTKSKTIIRLGEVDDDEEILNSSLISQPALPLSTSCSTNSLNISQSGQATNTQCDLEASNVDLSLMISPGASIINIGDDSVSMKESPPESLPPDTVSIDLGQITTSNSESILPRISVISTKKSVQESHIISPHKSSTKYSSPIFVSGGSLVRSVTDKVNLPSSYPSGSYVKSLPLQTTSMIPHKTHLTTLKSNSLYIDMPPSESTVKSWSTPTTVTTMTSIKLSQSSGLCFPAALPSPSLPSLNLTQTSTISCGNGAKLSKTHSPKTLPLSMSTKSVIIHPSDLDKISVTTPSSQILSSVRSSSGLITLQLGHARKDSAKVVHARKDSATVVTFSNKEEPETKKHPFPQQIYQVHDQMRLDKQGNSQTDLDQNMCSSSTLSRTMRTKSSVSTLLMTAQGKANLSNLMSGTKITHSTVPPVSKVSHAQGTIMLQYKSLDSRPASPQIPKPASPKLVMATTSETLGQVTSLLESSPITLCNPTSKCPTTAVTVGEFDQPHGLLRSVSIISSAVSCSTPQSQILPSCAGNRSSKTTISTYTTATKPVLPTIASTRTRRIKTPKQYDL